MKNNQVQNSELQVQQGDHYSVCNIGRGDKWDALNVDLPGMGEISGKLFLKEILGLSGSEISINALPAGAGIPFYHHHTDNEEVYIFIKGQGEMQVDGKVFAIGEGSVVRIAPHGVRVWRNCSDEPLLYIVVQTRADSLRQHTLDDGVMTQNTVTWPT